MRLIQTFGLLLFLVFAIVPTKGAFAADPAPAAAAATAAEDEELLVEDAEAVVPEKLDLKGADAAAAEPQILGISKFTLVPLLGILTWLLMAAAIVVRMFRIRKYALLLHKAHKFTAWAAFAFATFHGVLVMFF